MARGGVRPGAGRPRKRAVVPSAGTVNAPDLTLPHDVLVHVADGKMTPLEYMLAVMRDPNEDGSRRDKMAMAAAPFVHVRPADAKPGKKDERAEAAKVASQGKFAAAAAPLKLVSR